jgi:hypothetical protein
VDKVVNNQINLRFENLDYSIIKKKNINPIFILILNGFIYLSVAMPFLVLWLVGVPFEINEQMRQPTDIEYIRFMSILLGVFLSIAAISLVAAFILLKAKPKEYITIGKDIDYEEFYKIKKDKRNIIFIKRNKGIFYDEASDSIAEINSAAEINEILYKYLFWLNWNDIKEYKIKQKNKKTVLEFLEKNNRTVLKYRYTIPVSNSYLPKEITETITNRTRSQKSSLSSYNRYYFTDNNIQKNLNLPQKVFNYFYNQD